MSVLPFCHPSLEQMSECVRAWTGERDARGPLGRPFEPIKGSIASTSRMESSFGPGNKDVSVRTSGGGWESTDADDVAVFVVEPRVVLVLLSV